MIIFICEVLVVIGTLLIALIFSSVMATIPELAIIIDCTRAIDCW